MNRVFNRIAMLALCAILAACGRDSGPATAPTGIVVTPGDGQVTVSWNQDSSLTYWIFSADTTGSTTKMTLANLTTFPQDKTTWPANSPQVVNGLTNGRTYSFIMNATKDGGPAGPESVSIAVTPRLAGSVWTIGAPLGTANLKGVAGGASRIVTVGTGGALYYSTDAQAWTAGTSGVNTHLNSVVFNAPGAVFMAAGDAGVILTSTDGVNWTTRNTGNSANLYGVTVANSLNIWVAVGAGGTIFTSTDSVNWVAQKSGTTQDLYDVKFLNGTLVAVGASGTLLTSGDGVSWTARTVPTPTVALRSSTFATITSTSTSYFVVAGDAGTLLTSTDLVTWTLQTTGTTQNLNSVWFGSQLIAAGAGGTLLTSATATAWAPVTTTSSADLNAVIFSSGSYIAVGAVGANQVSK